MKILNKLTYDYLKLNKKKCIATLVSIILITVLLFSVGIFVSTVRKTALDAVIAEDGTKHVLFSEQDYSNYSILNSDENIKSIEITCLIDIINDELSIESIDDSLWDSISISKGRIPNNTNEIVISSAYAGTYNLDVSSFVGEKEVVGIYNNSTLKNDLYTAFTKEVDYNNRTVNFYVTYKNIFKYVKDALETDTLIILSMFNKNSGKFIGNIEFDNITLSNAEIKIIISEEFQNKHYGLEALKRLIEYGFNELNLEEIFLTVYSNNYRALHLYKKIGFIPYKIEEKVAIINGESVDTIYMKLHK